MDRHLSIGRVIGRMGAWLDGSLPEFPAALAAPAPPLLAGELLSPEVFFSLEFGDETAPVDEAWTTAIASYQSALRALVTTNAPGAWMEARACALELGRLYGSTDRGA